MVAILSISINHLSFISSPATVRSPISSSSAHMTKLRPIATTGEHQSQVALVGRRISNQGFIVHCSNSFLIPNNSNSVNDSGILMLFSTLKELGISDKKTELLLENYQTLRLTPIESIRARLKSLQTLGIDALALTRLINKSPDVLTAEEIGTFTCFLLETMRKQIDAKQIERLLKTIEPRFLLGFERKVKLLVSYGIAEEKLAHVLNNVNLANALCLKTIEDIRKMIDFLSQFGGIELIVRRPAILNYDLQRQVIPRINFLLEVSSGDRNGTTKVLLKVPIILAYSREHLQAHVELLRSVAGLSDPEIFKIILVYPNLFSASRERKLLPRITFLKQCGLSSHDIFKFLVRGPLFLTLSFEKNLAHKLVLLIKVGYKAGTRELALAMGAATRTSSQKMQLVIGLLLSYGLSCEDILAMGVKHPMLLQYNPESLEQKVDYLTEDLGREVGELLAFPAFLGYKLDDRIKKRYEVMRDVRGEGMSINKLLSVSTARFSAKAAKHYPEITGNNPREDGN